MKKAALILSSLFLIGALCVFWMLHRLGPSEAPQLVPKNTVALLEAPDIAAAITHWKGSPFARMGAESEIRIFLQRPWDAFYAWIGQYTNPLTPQALSDLIAKVKPGRCFIALEPTEKEGGWLVGCQFFGKPKAAQEALLQITKIADARFGTATTILLDAKEHHGELISQRSYASTLLYTAFRDNWFFVSTQVDSLQKALDFSAGRLAKKESLAASLLYQKNRAQLLKEPDLMAYFKRNPLLKEVPYAVSLFQKEPLLRSAAACGASWSFDEAGVKETLFLNGRFDIPETLSHQGLALTQPSSLAYIERISDWKLIPERLQTNEALPAPIAQFLLSSGLDFVTLASSLKPTMTLVINWLEGRSMPSLFVAAPEADAEKVTSWLDQAATPLNTTVQTVKESDLSLVSMPALNPFIQPTFASAHGSFFIATTPSLLKEQASRPASSPTLAQAPAFAKNSSLYQSANEAFFYFSLKEMVERGYELGRPSLLFGNTLFPQAKGIVDFSKIPSTAVLAKHITPIAIAQSHVEGGFLIQSQGFLSATPLFFLTQGLYSSFLSKKQEEDSKSAPQEQLPNSDTASPQD